MYIKIFQAFLRALLQCESKVCKPIHDVFIYISISWDNERQILNTLTSSLTAEHGALLEEKRITIVVVVLGFKIIDVLFYVLLSTL